MKIEIEVDVSFDPEHGSWTYAWRSALLHASICGGAGQCGSVFVNAGEAFRGAAESMARMSLNRRLMELEAEQKVC